MQIPLKREDRGGVKRGPKTGWREGYFTDKSNALMFYLCFKRHTRCCHCVCWLLCTAMKPLKFELTHGHINQRSHILCTQPLMTLLGAHEILHNSKQPFGEFLSKVRLIGRASPASAPLAVTWPCTVFIGWKYTASKQCKTRFELWAQKDAHHACTLPDALKEPSKGNGFLFYWSAIIIHLYADI